jgi:hypothetical protein
MLWMELRPAPELALTTVRTVLKESLTDAAQRWAVLAAELDTNHSLLKSIEDERKAG